jgi:hypothetical protein
MNLPLPRKTHVHAGALVGINRLTNDLTLQLPEGVACYTIANIGTKAGDLFGDRMVTVNSALGRDEDPS